MFENALRDIGMYVQEKYAHKFVNIENRKQKGICCFRNCNNDYVTVYCGLPFCEKHEAWVEERIEKLYTKETDHERSTI